MSSSMQIACYLVKCDEMGLRSVFGLFYVESSLTASGILSFPASFRHTASTAPLSVAWLAPCALVGRWGWQLSPRSAMLWLRGDIHVGNGSR